MSTAALTITAAEIPPEWIAALAQCLHDGGYAYRAGDHHTIEIKSQLTNAWMPKLLPSGGTHFATATDRDQILNALRR
jgi:hypothetical protein